MIAPVVKFKADKFWISMKFDEVFYIWLVSPKIIVGFWWNLICEIFAQYIFYNLGVWTPWGNFPSKGGGEIFKILDFDEIWYDRPLGTLVVLFLA